MKKIDITPRVRGKMSINRGLKQINSCALAIAMNEMPEDKEQLVHDNDK